MWNLSVWSPPLLSPPCFPSPPPSSFTVSLSPLSTPSLPAFSSFLLSPLTPFTSSPAPCPCNPPQPPPPATHTHPVPPFCPLPIDPLLRNLPLQLLSYGLSPAPLSLSWTLLILGHPQYVLAFEGKYN
ncbi:unnamed protein product [Gadus morhua 'NCC']